MVAWLQFMFALRRAALESHLSSALAARVISHAQTAARVSPVLGAGSLTAMAATLGGTHTARAQNAPRERTRMHPVAQACLTAKYALWEPTRPSLLDTGRVAAWMGLGEMIGLVHARHVQTLSVWSARGASES